MTLRETLDQARELLGTEETALESEILLRYVLKLSRSELFLSVNREMDPARKEEFTNLLKRRLSGEPIAYIVNNREFYGLDFYVDNRVLIPRPDTELLVEKAIEFAGPRKQFVIADIGTGCGAIAITMAKHLPDAIIYAVDISEQALEVAAINLRKHCVTSHVRLIKGNMLDVIPGTVDLVAANLPYVRESEVHGVSAGFEPGLALDGGEGGLDKIFTLCRQIKGKINRRGGLMLEIGARQKDEVVAFLTDLFPSSKIVVYKDLGGIDRVVFLKLP